MVQCSFSAETIIPFVILAIVILAVVIAVVAGFIIWKMRKMKKKVDILDEKEQAEIELTQKLMDLQALYTSELEGKYSFKNWLIKVEDIELIKKIGEGGNGFVYLAK